MEHPRWSQRDIAAAALWLAAALGGCKDDSTESAHAASSSGAGQGGGGGSSVTAASSTATGTSPCAGVANFGEGCTRCLERSCCAEIVEWGGVPAPVTAELLACADAACAVECRSPPPLGPPACDAPLPAPSLGACVRIGRGVECNPLTNERCGDGQACDEDRGGAFGCFDPPNDAPLCAACDNDAGPFCVPGAACLDGLCAAFCCDDGDCGTGTCVAKLGSGPMYEALPLVGLCIAPPGSGGGGAGGAP